MGFAFQDLKLLVGVLGAAVAGPSNVVPVEDLFVPCEEGVGDVAELEDLAGAVGIGEPLERLRSTFAVVGGVEVVQLAERVPGCLEPQVGGEQDVGAGPLSRVELVGTVPQQEPCPEHVGVHA